MTHSINDLEKFKKVNRNPQLVFQCILYLNISAAVCWLIVMSCVFCSILGDYGRVPFSLSRESQFNNILLLTRTLDVITAAGHKKLF